MQSYQFSYYCQSSEHNHNGLSKVVSIELMKHLSVLEYYSLIPVMEQNVLYYLYKNSLFVGILHFFNIASHYINCPYSNYQEKKPNPFQQRFNNDLK
jgi:hypothetical protein